MLQVAVHGISSFPSETLALLFYRPQNGLPSEIFPSQSLDNRFEMATNPLALRACVCRLPCLFSKLLLLLTSAKSKVWNQVLHQIGDLLPQQGHGHRPRSHAAHPCDVFGDCFEERLEVNLEIFEGKTLVAFAHLINIFRITVCGDFS